MIISYVEICSAIFTHQKLIHGGCTMWDVVVDRDKCNGDEECVDACPSEVFEMVDGKSSPVNMDECLGCETCIEVCPEGAITVTEV
jgi:NAD-dependent dihydropyrimidine dehydrogenase PreA subunit